MFISINRQHVIIGLYIFIDHVKSIYDLNYPSKLILEE